MKKTIELTDDVHQFYWRLQSKAPFMVGYPGNLNNDFSNLYRFFEFIINNVGDPLCTCENYKMHSKEYELKVLNFFKKLYGLNQELSWGYLTNGGTESNVMGLLLARTKYPKSNLFSTNGHYSVRKNAFILNIPYVEVKKLNNGEIDYENLSQLLMKEKEPPIINLTIGTTFEGATDSIDKTINVLEQAGHKEFYIHCDAALFGGFIPFLEIKHEIDFEKPINSISISTHKFFGIPFPSGVFLTKNQPYNGLIDHIGYIDADDTTISGSRIGQLPILLWSLIKEIGVDGFTQEAKQCVGNAKYLKDKLFEKGFNPLLNENSNIVSFDIPLREVINKWQLAVQGSRTHVVVMQHVTRKVIDLLVNDLN